MTTTDPKLIEPVAWLIERRVSPPQWSIDRAPTGVGSFYSDIHRAHRFDTREAAEDAMRRMCITAKERGEYFVSEHAWIAPFVPDVVGMDEDWLEEVISDSIDMDWRPRDAARLILSRLGEVASPTAAAINEAALITQGIEAGTGETARLDPQDESPVAESDAPDHPTIEDYRNRLERAEAECNELRAERTELRSALLVTRACLQIAKGQFDDPDAFKALNHAIEQASTALNGS